MLNTKMVVVVRKDLKMPLGKILAQSSHAVMGSFLKAINIDYINQTFTLSNVSKHWLENSFTKVVLRVESEQELLNLYAKIKDKVPCALIKDEGRTVFKEPTYTCLGIGPDEVSKIDKITGDLKLL